MELDSEALIRDVVAKIVQETDPERVVLFGSRATGRYDNRSDIDLLVEVSDEFGPRRSRKANLSGMRRALRTCPVPVDLLVFTTSEVEAWRKSINHVVARALREGRICYARS